jgi:predicted Ser/Thr protein kinase
MASPSPSQAANQAAGFDSPSTPTGQDQDNAPTLAYAEKVAPPHVIEPGQGFGNYELLKEIARGGMGVVYKARQKSLDRIVAVKMILPGPKAKPEDLERFRLEAEATARLQHPNIVTVYEVGEINGQPFYSMDFIDGPSLSQRMLQGPLPGRQAARYAMTIARALHHAHSHGILHRDIKPSNILLDSLDEPHITDFGLAKRLGAASDYTRSGAIMGTPSYMAPEQAAGKTKELGPACDVYGLGAVLYELLTGRPPFRSETPLDTVRHVLEQDPAPPRLLNPKVDRDLETICLKCLQKDPRQRYASAEALAEDLNRYLIGESITARSFNMIDRLARTLDRSQYDFEFQGWGTMLLWFGAIVFAVNFVVFGLSQTGFARGWLWLCRAAEYGLIGLTFRRARSWNWLPTNQAERQLWTIWIGYVIASIVVAIVARLLVGHQILDRGEAAPSHWQELYFYPVTAVLSGLGFFIMGSNYWGRCYAVGVGFFALAILMSLRLEWAPLEFGTAWGTTLVALGLHLRSLGRAGGRDSDTNFSLPSSGPAL